MIVKMRQLSIREKNDTEIDNNYRVPPMKSLIILTGELSFDI